MRLLSFLCGILAVSTFLGSIYLYGLKFQQEEARAKEILASQGYSNIVMTGYSFFGCSEDDTFANGFTATAPSGATVTGVVCSGILKGSTVRLY